MVGFVREGVALSCRAANGVRGYRLSVTAENFDAKSDLKIG